MSIRDVLAFLGVARNNGRRTIQHDTEITSRPSYTGVRPTYPQGVQRLPVPVMEPWNCYFTLDDEHQVVVTVKQDSLLLGTYEQTIEVQVCGSNREDCVAAYFRYLGNCE